MELHTFSGYGIIVNGFLSSTETECEFLMRLFGVGGSSCSAAFRFGSKRGVRTSSLIATADLTFKNHGRHVAGEWSLRRISMELIRKRCAATGDRNGLPWLAVGTDMPGGPKRIEIQNLRHLARLGQPYLRISISFFDSIVF